jgi:hypothetical protein
MVCNICGGLLSLDAVAVGAGRVRLPEVSSGNIDNKKCSI